MKVAGFSFQQDFNIGVLAVMLFSMLFYSSVAWSEVRVIVEYDSTGHRLVQVVELPADRAVPVSDHLGAKSGVKSKEAITPADTIRKVKLRWFGNDGALISTALMDDPRLTHAPLTGNDLSPTVVGLDSGAFMVTGPLESAVLEIHMPENAALGLDQQFWRMVLIR